MPPNICWRYASCASPQSINDRLFSLLMFVGPGTNAGSGPSLNSDNCLYIQVYTKLSTGQQNHVLPVSFFEGEEAIGY